MILIPIVQKVIFKCEFTFMENSIIILKTTFVTINLSRSFIWSSCTTWGSSVILSSCNFWVFFVVTTWCFQVYHGIWISVRCRFIAACLNLLHNLLLTSYCLFNCRQWHFSKLNQATPSNIILFSSCISGNMLWCILRSDWPGVRWYGWLGTDTDHSV